MSVDPTDIFSAFSAIGSRSGLVDQEYAVTVLRKAQDTQRLRGEAAVRLIDSSGPQTVRTADGHISVRA